MKRELEYASSGWIFHYRAIANVVFKLEKTSSALSGVEMHGTALAYTSTPLSVLRLIMLHQTNPQTIQMINSVRLSLAG